MYTERTLKHARQAKADNDALQATLRVEGRKLLAIASDKRTADQVARLAACETELDAAVSAMAGITAEIVTLERGNAEMIAEHAGGPGHLTAAPRGRRYAEMFPGVRLDAGGFANSNEFLATLHSGLADPRLIPAYHHSRLGATMTVGTPSDGGFSVPTQFFQQWLDSSMENEIVRTRAPTFAR